MTHILRTCQVSEAQPPGRWYAQQLCHGDCWARGSWVRQGGQGLLSTQVEMGQGHSHAKPFQRIVTHFLHFKDRKNKDLNDWALRSTTFFTEYYHYSFTGPWRQEMLVHYHSHTSRAWVSAWHIAGGQFAAWMKGRITNASVPREGSEGGAWERKEHFWGPKSGHLFHGFFCLPGAALHSDLTHRTCWASPVSKYGGWGLVRPCQTQQTWLTHSQKCNVTALSIQMGLVN